MGQFPPKCYRQSPQLEMEPQRQLSEPREKEEESTWLSLQAPFTLLFVSVKLSPLDKTQATLLIEWPIQSVTHAKWSPPRILEALAEAQRAVELDPLSIPAHNAAALAAFSSDKYDRTIEEGRKILELDANDARAYQDLFAGHFIKGMYQEALQDAEKGLTLTHRDPFFLALAAVAHSGLGEKEQAAKLVEEMRAANKNGSVAPYFFALAFVGMGKQKEAIDALEKAYKTHDAYLAELQADPLLGPLHSDPRFQDLVRRMNFPAVSRPAKQ